MRTLQVVRDLIHIKCARRILVDGVERSTYLPPDSLTPSHGARSCVGSCRITCSRVAFSLAK